MNVSIRLRIAAAGLALAGSLIVAGSAIGAGDRPAPGLYKITSVIAGEKPRVAQECMSAADIAEAFTLQKAPGTCAVARNVVGGGRVDMAQTCTAGRRTSSGSIAGSYSAASYQLRVQARAPELPVPLDVRISAQRIGACTDD